MNQPNFFKDENRDSNTDDSQSNVEESVGKDIDTSPKTNSISAHESHPLKPSDDTPILAELVHTETPQSGGTAQHSPDNPYGESGAARFYATPALDLSNELHNMASNGGAVGSLVLGCWSIICALITHYAVINAVIAILLGIYGWSSPRRKLAYVGIVLGVIGMLMSLMEINELLGNYWVEEEF